MTFSTRICICTLFLIVASQVSAQESLKALGGNPALIYRQEVRAPQNPHQIQAKKQQTVSLQLPFKDDFYYATTSPYPDQQLWMDSMVYVNTGFPIDPISIGVATFDGLNKHGYPHTPKELSLIKSQPADTLTSRPINLSTAGNSTLTPSDSIALLFYYQARGYGDPPEIGDSLMVELYSPVDSLWTKVWAERGNTNPNLIDSSFKRAFIRITDPRYLKDGFQFRIRNKATTAGNFDHWHVDYVYLNRNVSRQDTLFDDLTFAYPAGSLLYDYSSMPHNQYRAKEMNDNMKVWIKNNRLGVISMSYEHKVFDENNQQLHAYDGGPTNLGPYHSAGYDTIPAHTNINLLNHYTLTVPPNDSVDFFVRHIVFRGGSTTNEFFGDNDTLRQVQKFRNYYAFDDGGAEAGYYLNYPQARMALKIRLNETDTFRAMRIYFDPVGKINESQETGFRIMVWQAGSNGPAAVQHSFSTVHTQKYVSTGHREIPEYKLDAPVVLSAGTYYIGIQQLADYVTVGFDRNYDSSKSLFYSTGSSWNQSATIGSLMMRPVFGRYIEPPVGVRENLPATKNFRLYPNPARDYMMIESSVSDELSYFVLNPLGAMVMEGTCSTGNAINTRHLPEGIYFMMVQVPGQSISTQKFIIRR